MDMDKKWQKGQFLLRRKKSRSPIGCSCRDISLPLRKYEKAQFVE